VGRWQQAWRREERREGFRASGRVRCGSRRGGMAKGHAKKLRVRAAKAEAAAVEDARLAVQAEMALVPEVPLTAAEVDDALWGTGGEEAGAGAGAHAGARVREDLLTAARAEASVPRRKRAPAAPANPVPLKHRVLAVDRVLAPADVERANHNVVVSRAGGSAKYNKAMRDMESVRGQGRARERATAAARAPPPVAYDLWGEDSGGGGGGGGESLGDGAASMSKRKADVRQKRLRPKPSVPAVVVDAPGCSYNPEVEAHRDVLHIAAGIELAKKGEARRLRNVSRPAPGEGWEEIDFVQFRAEDAEADGGREADAAAEGEKENVTGGAEKKTSTQRNRALRREAAEREKRARDETKRLRAQLDRVGDFAAELAAEEAAVRAKAEATRAAIAARDRLLPAKLGRHRYDPLPLQVQLTEDVTGSIRMLKPTAKLVEDRFKSLQGRQMLEAGRRLHKPKSKSEYATSSKHRRHYSKTK